MESITPTVDKYNGSLKESSIESDKIITSSNNSLRIIGKV
jgi:hypothetical protein